MYGFEEGDKVKILSSDKTSNSQYKHTIKLIGTVKRFKYSSIGVKLDMTYNQNSNQGLFWYKPEEITIIHSESEEKSMSKLTDFNKVTVIRTFNGVYHFALYDDNVQPGDLVYTNNAGEKVLTVEGVISSEKAASSYSGDITKEVIYKIDNTSYKERVYKRKKKAELQKKMDAMIKQMDETNKYKMYADSNPELAELLSKYESL